MGKVNTYGQEPYNIVLLHGGPGAIGEMNPVAQHICSTFGVLEPLQSKYTIQELVEELKQSIEEHTDEPVILVGYSWGAWLAVISASKYPNMVKKLILISSGPFEQKYVHLMNETREKRMSAKDTKILKQISKELDDTKINKEKSMIKMGELYNRIDSYSPIKHDLSTLKLDLDMYNSIWFEASNMRRDGELTEHLKRIACPIVAIHGDHDGHPYIGVKEPLEKYTKDTKFILLKQCGHTPWYEKKAKDKFYNVLKSEIRE